MGSQRMDAQSLIMHRIVEAIFSMFNLFIINKVNIFNVEILAAKARYKRAFNIGIFTDALVISIHPSGVDVWTCR
jgi:hypothetical protein